MNEEEKEAIENIKGLEILFEIDDNKDFEATPSVQKEIVKDLKTLLNLITKLQKENEELKSENRRLKVIRYSTEYGTENIHLITKRDLVEINTNKYFIEIQDGKFVDLKQVYQENEKLNKYKENYISVQRVKDKIEEIQEEGYWLFTTDRDSDKCVEVLQELIEEREEK